MNELRIIDGRHTYRTANGSWAVSADDASRSVKHYNPGGHDDYSAECPSCWLGHGHTLAYHVAALERARASAVEWLARLGVLVAGGATPGQGWHVESARSKAERNLAECDHALAAAAANG